MFCYRNVVQMYASAKALTVVVRYHQDKCLETSRRLFKLVVTSQLLFEQINSGHYHYSHHCLGQKIELLMLSRI